MLVNDLFMVFLVCFSACALQTVTLSENDKKIEIPQIGIRLSSKNPAMRRMDAL